MSFNTPSPKMKRSTAARGRQRAKTPQNTGAAQSQAFDGLYQNERLVNSVTSVLGCTARVSGKSGKTFEGIFKTISPEGSLVLGKANLVDEQLQNGVVPPGMQKNIHEQFVMNRKDWVKVEFQDVDLDECSSKKDGFKTDAVIAKKMNGQPQRELEKWQPSGDVDGSLEAPTLEGSRPMSNGWSADEMFNTNAKKYGVKSTYNPNMEEYTTKLEKKDTPEYREKEKVAKQLADEIENESSFERGTLDSGRTEEQLYSSVVRNRSSQQNWRERSEKDQRPQKQPRDGSGSPAIPRKQPVKTSQVDEQPKIQIKEKVVKPTTEVAVESKPEPKVEVPSEITKEAEPAQNVKPEVQSPPIVVPTETPDEAQRPETSESAPDVPGESKINKDPVLHDLKKFASDFQLKLADEKKSKKNSDEDKKVLKEKKKEDIVKETPEEPETPQEIKADATEVSSTGKKTFILNPNAQEFRPVIKRNTPSPRSSSTPSSGGAASPFQPQSPYGMSPYHPGGGNSMYRPRPRGGRPEFMEQNYVNANNAAGQPFFAQPVPPFMPSPLQPANVPYIPGGHRHHPMQPTPSVYIQNLSHGQPSFVVPVGQMAPGHYGEPAQFFYSPHNVQMLQSPPQIQSPSLPQSHFTFPTVPLAPAVRSVSQIQPQPQQPIMPPAQIITQNRPSQSANYQGN